MTVQILQGDCLDVLRTMPDDSVDAVVTDPPYGIAFMGRKWDYDVPAVEVWAECLRVLKPGGHLLAFASTRTQHRMAARIEDAGFGIRDMIAWVYGSGFPKSLDVSKAIDAAAGAERKVVGSRVVSRDFKSGEGEDTAFRSGRPGQTDVAITAPATSEAAEWDGWGTALKPALEPITLARKPLAGTVATNVLAHGTGALNIDGCRIDAEARPALERAPMRADVQYSGRALAGRVDGSLQSSRVVGETTLGRWPANLIHDGSAEVMAKFPSTQSGVMRAGTRRAAQDEPGSVCYGTFGGNATATDTPGDSGSAARFFYCAKASAADRNDGCEQLGRRGNHHPTVKPTDLMRYLCRLVTPPGGVVLAPFMGTGSTGRGAALEGFRFIGIEREAEYVEIARLRIGAATRQGRLFA